MPDETACCRKHRILMCQRKAHLHDYGRSRSLRHRRRGLCIHGRVPVVAGAAAAAGVRLRHWAAAAADHRARALDGGMQVRLGVQSTVQGFEPLSGAAAQGALPEGGLLS